MLDPREDEWNGKEGYRGPQMGIFPALYTIAILFIDSSPIQGVADAIFLSTSKYIQDATSLDSLSIALGLSFD